MRAKLLLLPLIAGLALAPCASSAYTYKIIHNFCSKRLCVDGSTPMSGLVADGAGNFYGTTEGNSTQVAGSVYKLSFDATAGIWRLVTLYNFTGDSKTEGYAPIGSPIVDVGGNVYGTNHYGGSQSGGTAFELVVDGTKRIFKLLASFDPHDGNGDFPTAALSYQGAASGIPYDGVSPLYGSLESGGVISNSGAVIQLVPSGGTWTRNTIYRFCAHSCSDGYEPSGAVLVDGGGNLLGTARLGGAKSNGVVYKISDIGGGWSETVLRNFCRRQNCRDGGYPEDSVIADASGNLFGVAGKGKNSGCCGVLFELQPDLTYGTLYKFCQLGDCRDGDTPRGPLLMDASGTLIGATRYGGGHNAVGVTRGGGTLFAWDGTALQTLYRFCAKTSCVDGAYPTGGLVADSAGNLLGTTEDGGENGVGVIFELSP